MRVRSEAVILSCLVLASCAQDAEPAPWTTDEEIIIWTDDYRDDPTPDPQADVIAPDDPAVIDDPVDPVDGEFTYPSQPTVAPVLCDADYPVLEVPGKLAGSLPPGQGMVAELPCTDAIGEEERIRLEVPRRMGVEIYLSYEQTEFSPALLLQQGCGDDTVDLQCSAPLRFHPDPYSAHIRTVLDAGSYTLVVDERDLRDFGGGGRFVVHAEEYDLEVNALCEHAERLYPDNIGYGVPSGGSTDDVRGCWSGASSRQYWTMHVAAGASVGIRAAYDDADIEDAPYLSVTNSCHTDCESVYGEGALSIANDSDEGRDFIVAVSDHREASYRVWMDSWELLADHAVCENAQPLPAGVTTPGDLMQGSPHAALCGHNDTRMLHYSVDVPPQHRLIAHAVDANVGVQQRCGADECLHNPVNLTDQDRTYIVTVGNLWNDGRQFHVTADVVPLATNSTCGTAQPLAIGEVATGSLLQGGDLQGACSFVHGAGYALWYRVDIPPMSAVQVDVRGDSEFPNLSAGAIQGACDGACAAVHDPYLDGPTSPRLTLDNPSTETMSILVNVTLSDLFDVSETFEIEVVEVVIDPPT